MRRFFGSSSIAQRLVPGAPSFVKQIPVPRTTKTSADVAEVLGHEIAGPAEDTQRDLPYLASVFPQEISADQLKQPEGVWYHVARSRTGKLPVYLDYNNAGGVWTEVRKVSGQAGALRNDLMNALGLQKKDIWVKNAANAVVIKGNWREEVKQILAEAF